MMVIKMFRVRMEVLLWEKLASDCPVVSLVIQDYSDLVHQLAVMIEMKQFLLMAEANQLVQRYIVECDDAYRHDERLEIYFNLDRSPAYIRWMNVGTNLARRGPVIG